MGTVIDSLIVEFNLDPSKFTQGQKDALNAFDKTKDRAAGTAKEIEASGKRAAEFFSRMKVEALGLLGVFLGVNGIKDLITQTNAAATSVGYLASNLNMSTKDMSAWEQMMGNVGGAAADADSSISGLFTKIQNWQRFGGNPEIISGLNFLGVKPEDYNDMNKVLLDISGARAGMSQSDFAYYAKTLGLSDSMINELGKGRPQVESDLAAAHATAIDDDEAQKSQKFTQAMNELQNATNKLWLEFQNDFTPAITNFAKTLEALAANPDVQQFFKSLGIWAAGGPPPAQAGKMATDLKHVDVGSTNMSFLDAFFAPFTAFADAVITPKAEEVGFAALLQQESSGGRQFRKGKPLTSSKGAVGASQITEPTAIAAAKLAGVDWDRNRWQNDRDYNLKLGAAWWHHLMSKYGDLSMAWAAYNSGTDWVDKAVSDAHAAGRDGHWGDYMQSGRSPSAIKETNDYLRKVSGFYNQDAGSFGLQPITITGPVTIVTQATDAAGIKSGLTSKVQQLAQANRGIR